MLEQTEKNKKEATVGPFKKTILIQTNEPVCYLVHKVILQTSYQHVMVIIVMFLILPTGVGMIIQVDYLVTYTVCSAGRSRKTL